MRIIVDDKRIRQRFLFTAPKLLVVAGAFGVPSSTGVVEKAHWKRLEE